MTRQELYKSMEREKIIMSDRLRKRLDQTDLSELHARWIGVLDLANEHKPLKRRADWLAKIFWNDTAASDHTEAMERLSCKIDTWEAEEHRPIRRALTVRLWKAASVAACAVLVVGLSLQLLRPSTPRDTFDNPEDAYTATCEALLVLSSALNKGTEYVGMAMETGGKVERNVNHQLEILKELNNN